MEKMVTLNVKAELSVREVTNQYLSIPFERRVHMLDRLTKPKTVGNHKVNLKNSIKFLTENELTADEIGIILNEIRLFEKELNKKHDKLQKEFDK